MNEVWYYIIGWMGAGLISWGAIRADIKHMLREIAEAKAIATRAHTRIDELLLREQK